MTRQYHFVIMFDEETKQWDFDIDNEEVAFNNGTIYNKETQELYDYDSFLKNELLLVGKLITQDNGAYKLEKV